MGCQYRLTGLYLGTASPPSPLGVTAGWLRGCDRGFYEKYISLPKKPEKWLSVGSNYYKIGMTSKEKEKSICSLVVSTSKFLSLAPFVTKVWPVMPLKVRQFSGYCFRVHKFFEFIWKKSFNRGFINGQPTLECVYKPVQVVCSIWNFLKIKCMICTSLWKGVSCTHVTLTMK